MKKPFYTALLLLLCLVLAGTVYFRVTAEAPAPAPVPDAQTPAPAVPNTGGDAENTGDTENAENTENTAGMVAQSLPPVSLPLRINELMASNKSTLADGEGLFPDWVELYAYGDEPVDLSQLVLVCGNEISALPQRSLAPGEYFVLFCDGGGDGRVAFKLPKEGGTLALQTVAGNPVESFDYPALHADESACYGEAGGVTRSLAATPGYENSEDGYAAFQAAQQRSSALLISEVMVYNEWLLPQGGEYYDWIELKNVSDDTLELSGYFLSDSGSDRARYRLPSRSLAPGEQTLVYCTGDGGTGAPFSLNASSEQLFLSREDGTLCDYVHLQGIPLRGSMGRQDGENGFFYFTSPSPGENNSDGFRCATAKPVLLGEDGVFDNVESVTVTLAASGEIHYTLDGSTPTASSPLYSEPLVLTKTSVVRAVNIRPDMPTGESLDLSYILNENHTLPVVSLVAEPGNLFGGNGLYDHPTMDWERVGSVALYEDGKCFSLECGIKLHGATSKLAQRKKSFKLCFRSRYDGELEYDLFENGVTEFSSILLRAAQESTYSTLMRDNLMHQLAIQCFPELPSQDYKYAVLYINGAYWGVYNIREAHSAASYANHYGYDEDSVVQWKENWDPEGPMAEILRFALGHSLAGDDNYNQVAEHVNVDSVIGWTILQAYCGNYDCNPPNMRYFYSSEDDMMRFVLVDLDLGMFTYDLFDVPLHGSVVDGSRYSYGFNKIANKLMENKQYQLRMAEQLSAALTGPMSNDKVLALIDELADQIRPEIDRDRVRWAQGNSSADTADYWEHGYQMVDYLRDFVTRKGGRAQQLVSSFISHSSLTAEEQHRYFDEVK